MSSTTLLTSLFSYKAWANKELFACVASIDTSSGKDATDTAQASARHAALRLLNHIYVVDCIFFANLQQRAHPYTATNTPETPLLNDLQQAVEQLDTEYKRFIENISPAMLEENIMFTFTDGDKGCMSREEMLMHVIAHGTYHRGAVGRILSQISIAPRRDLYTKFLHTSEPLRRH